MWPHASRDCSQRYTSSERLRAHHGHCTTSSAQPAFASEALADGVPRRCVSPTKSLPALSGSWTSHRAPSCTKTGNANFLWRRVHPVLRHARPPRRHRRLPLVLQRRLPARDQRRSECKRPRTIALRKDGARSRRQHPEEEETAVGRGEKVKEGESGSVRCASSSRSGATRFVISIGS